MPHALYAATLTTSWDRFGICIMFKMQLQAPQQNKLIFTEYMDFDVKKLKRIFTSAGSDLRHLGLRFQADTQLDVFQETILSRCFNLAKITSNKPNTYATYAVRWLCSHT